MEDKSVFNRLILGLSQDERLEMLKKMHTITPPNDLPLKSDYSDEEYDYEKSYQMFSLLEKIFIFFTVLFSTKERDKVIENLSMDKLARQLDKTNPDLINYPNKIFLNNFLLEIEKLRDSLDIFTNTLPAILNSNESDFIAFLVGLHFPEVEAKLLYTIDPKVAASDYEFESSFQLKRHIEFRIDEILGEIDSDKKKIIYREIKNIHVLNALSVFNFENIIAAFAVDEKYDKPVCNFLHIRKNLHNLLDILFSLNISPSTDTLNAVFMFASEIKNPDNNSELEEILKQNMEDVKITFDIIRKFNSTIPLESMLCLVNRNMNFHPAHIGGAEDWYALFRRFWYKKFDLMMEKFAEDEKRVQLEEDSLLFLNIKGEYYLDNYKDGLWGKNTTVKFKGTSGFIKKFMTTIFTAELIGPLKLVLIDGQFYKEKNRLDYNSSYRTLIDVVDLIDKLDASLSPEGEYLSGNNNVKLGDDEAKEEIITELKLYIDNEFGKIISNFNQALGLLIDVISGIVQGEMGGVYDTLSNLGYIGKGKNKNLIAQLNEIRFKLDEARTISHQLYDLENGQRV